MKKRLIILFLALMGMGVRAWAYENTYALIIGVADYKNFSEYEGDLSYTVSDAMRFAAFLKSPKGGSIPAINICLLVDSQATRANIIAKGKALFAKAKKNDRVIFFFSGHGDRGCFLPWDVTEYGDNMLDFSDVKAIFRMAKCDTKLLFADACFAGSMRDNSARGNFRRNVDRGRNASSNTNIAVMMSCKGNETSLEAPDLHQGLFTYYLMKGLAGEANTDHNRFVTIQELYYYVYHKVKDDAARRNHSQTPDLFGKFDLGLIVAKV